MTRKSEAYVYVPFVIYEDYAGLRHVQFASITDTTVKEVVEHLERLRSYVARPGITIIDSGYKPVVVQYEQYI